MVFHTRSASLAGILASILGMALANTEIMNFASVVSPAVEIEARFGMNWHELHSTDSFQQLELPLAPYGQPWSEVCRQPDCEHEIFVKLALGKNYHLDQDISQKQSRYSLRISWPASTPANFNIEIYTPIQLQNYLLVRADTKCNTTVPHDSSYTQIMYARIRARDAGVRAPKEYHFLPPLVLDPSERPKVTFHLVLDPLLLGIIPQSVVPTIWLVLISIVVGAYVAGLLIPPLESVAANVDLYLLGRGVAKEE